MKGKKEIKATTVILVSPTNKDKAEGELRKFESIYLDCNQTIMVTSPVISA